MIPLQSEMVAHADTLVCVSLLDQYNYPMIVDVDKRGRPVQITVLKFKSAALANNPFDCRFNCSLAFRKRISIVLINGSKTLPVSGWCPNNKQSHPHSECLLSTIEIIKLRKPISLSTNHLEQFVVSKYVHSRGTFRGIRIEASHFKLCVGEGERKGETTNVGVVVVMMRLLLFVL